MKVNNVIKRWIWFSYNNELEEDESLLVIENELNKFFNGFILQIPRGTSIKRFHFDFVEKAKEKGLIVLFGHRFFHPPWTNKTNPFYDPFFTHDIMTQIHTEVKVLKADGAFIDFEPYKNVPEDYYPQREDIYTLSDTEKRLIDINCQDILARGYVEPMIMSYPDHGSYNYGETWKRLSYLKWSPGTYRLKGGEHPFGGDFWCAWGTLDPTQYPQFPKDERPLTIEQIYSMEIPDDTKHFGLYININERLDFLRKFCNYRNIKKINE